jgi:hypothetical protein
LKRDYRNSATFFKHRISAKLSELTIVAPVRLRVVVSAHALRRLDIQGHSL